jgi:hypothetical protein
MMVMTARTPNTTEYIRPGTVMVRAEQIGGIAYRVFFVGVCIVRHCIRSLRSK